MSNTAFVIIVVLGVIAVVAAGLVCWLLGELRRLQARLDSREIQINRLLAEKERKLFDADVELHV